ncbi:MAG TPA: TatD family hydrolase [Myxococcales bacterium]|nr:TatD family hydrolase [Myxococcales bacterium]
MPHASVAGVFVDLHLHADGIPDQDLATLAYFGLKAAVTCARDSGAGSAAELVKHWDGLVQNETQRLKTAGIRPMVALALHPARIPWHGADDLLHRLPHYFDDPRVVALGELGLQDGGPREEEIFARQLELAARLQRPAIVHTPAKEKLQRTKRALALVKSSPLEPSQVLIDHVSDETFPLVRAVGCWAGLTVQPESTDVERAAQLVRKHGAERIVLTSDIGEGPTDLLALPKAAEALRKAGLSQEVVRQLMWDGPLAFLH